MTDNVMAPLHRLKPYPEDISRASHSICPSKIMLPTINMNIHK